MTTPKTLYTITASITQGKVTLTERPIKGEERSTFFLGEGLAIPKGYLNSITTGSVNDHVRCSFTDIDRLPEMVALVNTHMVKQVSVLEAKLEAYNRLILQTQELTSMDMFPDL